MELVRIEQLIDKYFEGQTSIAEERELKAYFSSSDVAQHLEQYRDVFGYFTQAKEQQFTKSVPLQPRKQFNVVWLSIAASIVIVFGVVTFRLYETEVQPTGELGRTIIRSWHGRNSKSLGLSFREVKCWHRKCKLY
jgi:hypothetical protein